MTGEGRIRNDFQVTAEVVDKEYCQARKPENRFKVIVAGRLFVYLLLMHFPECCSIKGFPPNHSH